jgi:enterochelin esterase-like enzyme
MQAPIQGRLLRIYFYSPSLRRRVDYYVYLPGPYTPARRLPVFYLLHGLPGRPFAFIAHARIETRLEGLLRLHLVAPMILVFPDGRIPSDMSGDSEWANTRAGRFESYVLDVVGDVDHRFATIPDRRDRAIAGLSAGAYGAINIALHHLAYFDDVQVWSGYFTQARAGVFARAGHALLAYNSPLDYVRRLGQALRFFPLHVFLYSGIRDYDSAQIVPMAAALRARGADVRYAIYRGGHSWRLWNAHTDQMLIMASRYFAHPSAVGSG